MLRISPKYRIKIRKLLAIIVAWMLIGVVIALCDYLQLLSNQSSGTSQYYDFALSIVINVGAGFTAGLIFGSILVFYVSERFRDKPYWITIVAVASLFVVVFSFIVMLVGFIIVPILIHQSLFEAVENNQLSPFLNDTAHLKNAIIWGIVVALTQFTLQVNDKFGQGVMWNIIRGRYQPPRQEDRIFMFVDLQSSTTIAEKLGNETYHTLLKDFFADITNAIIYNNGEIYQYIGDEIVITWKMEAGITNNRCLECYFDMRKSIFGLKEKYLSKYGLVPEFKAGIHYGTVIAGEIGIIKRDITYSGDVMNTASRIQGMCNTYNAKILCSDDLLQLLTLADHFTRIPLGEIELKGRESRVALSALEYRES